MSQWRWTFYDPHQGTQTLGLYHGEDSGHVMIVNELLVKLNLVENNGEFTYDFESKNTAIPPPSMMGWFKNLLAIA